MLQDWEKLFAWQHRERDYAEIYYLIEEKKQQSSRCPACGRNPVPKIKIDVPTVAKFGSLVHATSPTASGRQGVVGLRLLPGIGGYGTCPLVASQARPWQTLMI